MKTRNSHLFQTPVAYLGIGLLAANSFALGQAQSLPSPSSPAPSFQQQAANPSGGWKRVGDAPAPPDQSSPAAPYAGADQSSPVAPYAGADQTNSNPPPPPNQQAYPQPPYPQSGSPQPPAYGQQPPYNQPTYNQPSYQAPPPVPSQLTIPAGTFITVRVNQMLSSDRNQAGDAFSATLVEPLVVNGVVVAEPGQTIGGRVAEAVKAGHIEGVARLGIQLTTLTLVDGQQIPIQCQLVSRKGPTSVGQDAGTIATTTALGAAIGAAADWGRGAAIGAGAGAAAGILGVLVTRGHPSVIYPEQVLTFRLEAPVTIYTTNAPQAFRYVQPNEYDRPYYSGGPQAPGPAAYASPVPAYPYPYYYGYPYYGYPYYWGPSFSFYFGPRFYGGWYGGYRGWYGGRYYAGGGFVTTGAHGGVVGGFHASTGGVRR
jgi:hypothetical protein